MLSKSKLLVLLALPFFVSGCGDGFEMIKTDSYFPYGNQRTAGSGVAYVLAKMLPKKELNVQSVQRDWEPTVVVKEQPAPVPEPVLEPVAEPVQKADQIFLDDGKK